MIYNDTHTSCHGLKGVHNIRGVPGPHFPPPSLPHTHSISSCHLSSPQSSPSSSQNDLRFVDTRDRNVRVSKWLSFLPSGIMPPPLFVPCVFGIVRWGVRGGGSATYCREIWRVRVRVRVRVKARIRVGIRIRVRVGSGVRVGVKLGKGLG